MGQHPNILSLYQINLHYQKQLLIKEPYTSHLMGKRLTESEIENVLMDVSEALSYLGEKGIHMDWV